MEELKLEVVGDDFSTRQYEIKASITFSTLICCRVTHANGNNLPLTLIWDVPSSRWGSEWLQ